MVPFLGGFAALLALGLPIAMALGVASFLYLLFSGNIELMRILPQRMFGSIDQFVLLTVPLFLLAGNLMNIGGITERIIRVANACIGQVRGGLSLVNVIASLFFGGVSGAAAADTSALGSVLIPAMSKEGYPPAYSAALTSVSSLLSSVVPPSILLIMYGVLTSTSIAWLFMAGIVPALMMTFGLSVYAWWVARRHDYPAAEAMTIRQRLVAVVDAVPVLMLPVIIIGGIRFGVFTPTESAAVAVIYALFISAVVYRTLNWRNLWRPLVATALMTSAIMFIVAMASIVQFIFSFERIPAQVTELMLGISENRIVLLLMINIFLLILGMFLEPLAAMIVALPVLFDVATVIQIDPVHFGIIVVLNLAIGLTTPPVGICLFIACAISRVSLLEISLASLPMLAICIVVLLLITFIPDIALYVPSLAFAQ